MTDEKFFEDIRQGVCFGFKIPHEKHPEDYTINVWINRGDPDERYEDEIEGYHLGEINRFDGRWDFEPNDHHHIFGKEGSGFEVCYQIYIFKDDWSLERVKQEIEKYVPLFNDLIDLRDKYLYKIR